MRKEEKLNTNKNEGQVKDLVEKLERGEITPKETIEALKARRLTQSDAFKYGFGAWGYLIYVIPCYLPAIAKLSGLGILSFFAQLPEVEFPVSVIYLSIILFIATIPIMAWFTYYNTKKGGCNSEDHTVILLRSGLYRVVRHPGNVAGTVFFATLPIFLSQYLPFTISSVVGIVGIFAFHYYSSIIEERDLDLKKWGDEYREYMREVPRWNVFRGLWNLMRR